MSIKKSLIALLIVIMTIALTGCREADKVNYNLSKEADYFDVMRRITVYNARTDLVMFTAEGLMNLSNNSTNELVVTVKTGPNQYKKNYIYLNDYTMYVVEDINDGTYTDPYHYIWTWHTEFPLSSEVKP